MIVVSASEDPTGIIFANDDILHKFKNEGTYSDTMEQNWSDLQLMLSIISHLSALAIKWIDIAVKNQTKFRKPPEEKDYIYLTDIPHIATNLLTCLLSLGAWEMDSLVQIQRCSTDSTWKRQTMDQICAAYSSKVEDQNNQKQEMSWMLAMDVIERDQIEWSHRSFAYQSGTNLFALAVTTAGWTLQRSGIFPKQQAWMTGLTPLDMQRYFWNWTPTSKIGKSRLPWKTKTKPTFRFLKVSSDLVPCFSDWRMRQRCFKE